MQTHMRTSLSLPPPIADYFAADATDADGVDRCFTEGAIVIDERREHRGRRAIAHWKAEANAKYHYTSVPIAIDMVGSDSVVTAQGQRRLSRESGGIAVPLRARGQQNHQTRNHAMSFDLGLTGRRALVTAGTKGIGAAVVDVLRENGATVATTARSIPGDSLKGVRYFAADITTAEGCAAVAQ